MVSRKMVMEEKLYAGLGILAVLTPSTSCHVGDEVILDVVLLVSRWCNSPGVLAFHPQLRVTCLFLSYQSHVSSLLL